MRPASDPYDHVPKAPFALDAQIPGAGRHSSSFETRDAAMAALRQLAADMSDKDIKARVVDGGGILVAKLESLAVLGQVHILEFFHRT